MACVNTGLLDNSQFGKDVAVCGLVYAASFTPGVGFRIISNGLEHSPACKELVASAKSADQTTFACGETASKEDAIKAVKAEDADSNKKESIAVDSAAAKDPKNMRPQPACRSIRKQRKLCTTLSCTISTSSEAMSMSDDDTRRSTEQAIRAALLQAENNKPKQQEKTMWSAAVKSESADASADLLAAIEASPEPAVPVQKLSSLATRPTLGVDPRLAARHRASSAEVRRSPETPITQVTSAPVKVPVEDNSGLASSAPHPRPLGTEQVAPPSVCVNEESKPKERVMSKHIAPLAGQPVADGGKRPVPARVMSADSTVTVQTKGDAHLVSNGKANVQTSPALAPVKPSSGLWQWQCGSGSACGTEQNTHA